MAAIWTNVIFKALPRCFSDARKLNKALQQRLSWFVSLFGGRCRLGTHPFFQLDHFLVLLLFPLPEFLSIFFHLTHQLNPLVFHFLKIGTGWQNCPVLARPSWRASDRLYTSMFFGSVRRDSPGQWEWYVGLENRPHTYDVWMSLGLVCERVGM